MGRLLKHSISLCLVPDSDLNKLLKPNKQRANDLRRDFEKGFDEIARRIWPNLKYVHCVVSGEKWWFLPNHVWILFGRLGSYTTPYGTIIHSSLDPFSVQLKLMNWYATTLAKIDLSSDTSFWIFWLILTELHSQKGNILRKNPLPISLFTYYSLKIKFVPFLKS